MPPERSHAQRLSALEEANRIRSKRARLKEALGNGLSPLEVIDDPDCDTMKTVDLLMALPSVGRVKSNRMMRRAGVSPSKTLGGMSDRQRRDLLGMLA